jgi:hypothetical protein
MGVLLPDLVDHLPKAIIYNPVESFITEAMSYLQVRELPGNANRSVRIDYWNLEAIGSWKSFPLGGQGAPWCASYVTAVGRQSLGHAWPIPKTAAVQAMVDWARETGVWYEENPKRGDLFAVYYSHLNPARYGHVGIVVSTQGSAIKTVEGNTNEGGSREGYGIFERVRSPSEKYGYIRWQEALNNKPPI